MVSKAVQKLNDELAGKHEAGAFSIGDTVHVHVKIHEGDKERIQVFKGTVIARDGSGATETFTVRRVSHGVGVERVFPVHSPHVTRIESKGSSHVRRAKLYFLRDRAGRKARLRAGGRKARQA